LSEVKVEMILNGNITFERELEHDVVLLMMKSEFVTINSTTINVIAREVTDKGVVRFFGVKSSPFQHFLND
jgi:hypothetical protein